MFTQELEVLLDSPEPVSIGEESYSCDKQIVQHALTNQQIKFLQDLKIAVQVRVGDLIFNAEQVIELAPGQIFEFAIKPESQLALYVDNEQIATAKFAMIEDNLGLEILSVPS